LPLEESDEEEEAHLNAKSLATGSKKQKKVDIQNIQKTFFADQEYDFFRKLQKNERK